MGDLSFMDHTPSPEEVAADQRKRVSERMRSLSLGIIESAALRMISDASIIARHVRWIHDLPDYETKAEDVLSIACHSVQESLEKAVQLRRKLTAKRIAAIRKKDGHVS